MTNNDLTRLTNDELALEVQALLRTAGKVKTGYRKSERMELADLLKADGNLAETQEYLKHAVRELNKDPEDKNTAELKAYLVLNVPGVKERIGILLQRNSGLIIKKAGSRLEDYKKFGFDDGDDYLQEFSVDLPANIIKFDPAEGTFNTFLGLRVITFAEKLKGNLKHRHDPYEPNVRFDGNKRAIVYDDKDFDRSGQVYGTRTYPVDSDAIRAEEWKQAHAAIEGLSLARKKIILAKMADPDLSEKELGERIGMGRKAFAMGKSRAIENLREALNPDEDDSTKTSKVQKDPTTPSRKGR